MLSADEMVPCKVVEATINNVTTLMVTERIHLTVVLDSEHFKACELLQNEIESQEIEGFNTTKCMETNLRHISCYNKR